MAIIGFGEFGKLMTRYLSQRVEVLVYDRHGQTSEIIKLGGQPAELVQCAAADVVILAVTLDKLEPVLLQIKDLLRPNTLVADVTSVKVKPAKMMQQILPNNVQILATHPLFGPISAANSLNNQKIILDPIRVNDLPAIEKFLSDMGLEIVYMTCDEHDREMAWVHALTFFVGRGLLNMNPPTSPLTTHYYNELLDVVGVERTHSIELFNTIQRGNPYAKQMRQQFMNSLKSLEKEIDQ